MNRPSAVVHVDVDGLWAVRRCYGIAEQRSFVEDPVWEKGVPQLAEWFQRCNLPAQFFVVGRDLTHPEKAVQARELFAAGFEIGNHSTTHRIGLTRCSSARIRAEIETTQRLLERNGIPRAKGFRSPGYDVDERLLGILRDLGFQYDCSVLPTPLSPLLRLADAVLARRWNPRKRQFGQLRFFLAPRVPYLPDARDCVRPVGRGGELSSFVELPVSTVTAAGLPLTASSILALGTKRILGEIRQRAERGLPLVLLLHGIDAVDCSRPMVFGTRSPSAGGFNKSLAEKEDALLPVLQELTRHFEVMSTAQLMKGFLETL
ncbi:MAG: polysaccharide deacetylase family protein [Candidatus Sumerlaeia bacterium]|nr:polysaccharide deacetylase family protein [Candidatus Sumerlaeia bacterium]